jgi:pilus assembly protein CpaE
MAGIALITGVASFGMELQRAVGGEIPVARWPEDQLHGDMSAVMRLLNGDTPELVCLGPGIELDAALALAAAIVDGHPEVGVIMVAEAGGATWRRALRAGVQDVVPPEATVEDLALVVQRARQTAAFRRGQDGRHPGDSKDEARVVTVLSPKGGSGKTTIATNVSVALARRMTGQVALVDLDLQFGDVAGALQVDAVHTVGDAARAGDLLDATKLKVFLAPHASSLFTLCAPETPAEADDIGAASVADIIRLLHSDFPVVMVDTAAGLNEHALTAIDASTDLVFVCSMDVASVRALRKEIDAIDRLGLETPRRHLVLNRADSRAGLTAHDIESVLGLRIDTSLPISREVTLSMNEGVPVVDANPRAAISKALTGFAERFGSVQASQNQPARGLRLFRREAS